jgi:hypothetical protein
MVWNASCTPTSQRRSVGRLCHPCAHPRRDSPQVGPVEGSVLSATGAADKVKTVVRDALLVDLERLWSNYLGNKPTALGERLVGLTEPGARTHIIPPSQRQPSSNTSPNSRFSFGVSIRGYSGLAESKSRLAHAKDLRFMSVTSGPVVASGGSGLLKQIQSVVVHIEGS